MSRVGGPDDGCLCLWEQDSDGQTFCGPGAVGGCGCVDHCTPTGFQAWTTLTDLRDLAPDQVWDNAASYVLRLTRAVKQVRYHHYPVGSGNRCKACYVRWPCPTVADLQGLP